MADQSFCFFLASLMLSNFAWLSLPCSILFVFVFPGFVVEVVGVVEPAGFVVCAPLFVVAPLALSVESGCMTTLVLAGLSTPPAVGVVPELAGLFLAAGVWQDASKTHNAAQLISNDNLLIFYDLMVHCNGNKIGTGR